MRDIHAVIYREGAHWVAQALNVDVSSFGDTRQEARSALREALELYFEEDGGSRCTRRPSQAAGQT